MLLREHNPSVEIQSEECYSLGSADNTRQYKNEVNLSDENRPTSVHGIIVDGTPEAVIAASGGATGIHKHSALIHKDSIYIAVCATVSKLSISSREIEWSLNVDDATCFGIYYSSKHDALLSHGELSISRFSEDGKILWSTTGKDIFTESFELNDDFIEAKDFENMGYRFDYDTGRSL